MDDSSRIAMVRVGDGTYPGDIADGITYTLDNEIGSSTIRLRADGGVIDREEYYPFGDSSLRTFTMKRYRYVGREKDLESGLYYYGARYYAAWTCRFISVDPLAGKYAQLTPYNYADNNPINDYDIDGMQDQKTETTDSKPKNSSSNPAGISASKMSNDIQKGKSNIAPKPVDASPGVGNKYSFIGTPPYTTPPVVRPPIPIIEIPPLETIPITNPTIEPSIRPNPLLAGMSFALSTIILTGLAMLVPSTAHAPGPGYYPIDSPKPFKDVDDPAQRKVELFAYKVGSGSPTTLTPRPVDTIGGVRSGLSFWMTEQQAVANSTDKNPKIIKIDLLKVMALGFQVNLDTDGHVGIRTYSQEKLEEWAESRELTKNGAPPHALTGLLMSTVVSVYNKIR